MDAGAQQDRESGRLALPHVRCGPDETPDPRLEAICRLAARVLEMPFAAVALHDERSLRLRAAAGSLGGVVAGEHAAAFFERLSQHPDGVLVVEDARQDLGFPGTGAPQDATEIRFCAGMTLRDAGHRALGVLCVLDTRPRALSAGQLDTLRDLAQTAVAVLDLHRSIGVLNESMAHHRAALEVNPQVPWTASADGTLIEIGSCILDAASPGGARRDREDFANALHPDDVDGVRIHWTRSMTTGEPYDMEHRVRGVDGRYRWYRVQGAPRRDASGRIVRWYGIAEDITDRRESQARVEYLAFHDGLTGLDNRAQFDRRLAHEIARAERGAGFALLRLDLDSFRPINDTLGSAAGDELLRRVAARLMACIRGTDILSRDSADAFCIIQTDIARAEDAAVLADRIRHVLSTPFRLDGSRIDIGASIGITLCPQDGAHADKLLQNADLALDRAKSNARGGHCFFASEMDERQRTRQALKLELRSALERGEFRLVYQPVVGVRSGRVEAFEALLRWDHPTRGEVPPVEFIPVAESTGLIQPIGQWVMETACRDAAAWPRRCRVAVNLSAAQFRRRDLPDMVARTLAATGLAPERLELEITESLPLLDDDLNLSLLRQLRALGPRIVLDDFGTGYASLGYLQCFPFDKLKIDRSFVACMIEARETRTIVRSVLRLARALAIDTTAEGVETPQQVKFLRDEGCDQMQGYLLGRPLPAGELAALLRADAIEAGPRRLLQQPARFRT